MMARNCDNERMATALQYVALGSMIMMGVAGAVHIIKDVVGLRQERASYESKKTFDTLRGHGVGR